MNMLEIRDGIEFLMERSEAPPKGSPTQDLALLALVKSLRALADREEATAAELVAVRDAHAAVVEAFPESERNNSYTYLGIACRLAEHCMTD